MRTDPKLLAAQLLAVFVAVAGVAFLFVGLFKVVAMLTSLFGQP